mgnify:CR=1 FL=1
MSLLERLNQDMKEAMKNKDKLRLNVIRMIKASLQNEALKLGKDKLTEDEELTILNREVKQRKDSLQEFENAGRTDLVEQVKQELVYVQEYLPEQLSQEELQQLVKEVISEVGATSKADIGKVMALIMPKVKGRADGALVNKLVRTELGD